jgi:hypothetical protein
MKNTEYITNFVHQLPKGYVFTYVDFIGKVKSKEAIINAQILWPLQVKYLNFQKTNFINQKKSAFRIFVVNITLNFAQFFLAQFFLEKYLHYIIFNHIFVGNPT